MNKDQSETTDSTSKVNWPKVYALVLGFGGLFCLLMYLFVKYTT